MSKRSGKSSQQRIRSSDIDTFETIVWNYDQHSSPIIIAWGSARYTKKHGQELIRLPITLFSENSLTSSKARNFVKKITHNEFSKMDDIISLNRKINAKDGFVDGIFLKFRAVVDKGDKYNVNIVCLRSKYIDCLPLADILKEAKEQLTQCGKMPRGGKHLADREDVKLNAFTLYVLRFCVTIMNYSCIINISYILKCIILLAILRYTIWLSYIFVHVIYSYSVLIIILILVEWFILEPQRQTQSQSIIRISKNQVMNIVYQKSFLKMKMKING